MFVDVRVTNKSGQVVGLRLDEDSKTLKDIRKRVKADELEDVEVPAGKVSGLRDGRPKVREPINRWREWALHVGADPEWVAAAAKEDLQAYEPGGTGESGD